MKYFTVFTASFLALTCLINRPLLASTGELYGYGSRSSALGNTMMGGATDGYATFYNPAANSTHPGLNVSLGIGFMKPSFTDIKNVTTSNTAVSESTADTVGDVDTSSYLNHLGQMLGVSFNMGEKMKFLTLGATASMPIERIAFLDTGDPFKPEYFNYRARTQRPQIYASLSLTPFKNFNVGTGVSFATNLSGNTTVFAASSSQKISSQRFASTIKPSISPYFSAYIDPKPYQFGLTIRLPNTSKLSIDSLANANFLGGTANLPVNINSASSVFYDPLEIDTAAAYQFTPEFWATLEIDWFQYKAFESPSITITSLGSVGALNSTISTLPVMQNIVVPKVAAQYDLDQYRLRGGYSYRPSPVKDNSGPGNLIDPSKHIITAGVGIDLQKAKITEKQVFLDLHVQYHVLVKDHVSKSAGNEVGSPAPNQTGQTKVGSPGYDIGGNIFGGGLSITANF